MERRRVVGRFRTKGLAALLAAVVFALALVAGCGGGSEEGGGGSSNRGDITIAVVTHGQASDPFWSVVKNGVDQAAEDMGIDVRYNAPETFDMVKMGQLIDAAVATEPDGLAVSVPDADALREPIQKAVDAGIPVVTLNSGVDVYEELGALTHIGQTETVAGEWAGERLAQEGVTNALCVNQEVGNVALDQRRSQALRPVSTHCSHSSCSCLPFPAPRRPPARRPTPAAPAGSRGSCGPRPPAPRPRAALSRPPSPAPARTIPNSLSPQACPVPR